MARLIQGPKHGNTANNNVNGRCGKKCYLKKELGCHIARATGDRWIKKI